MTEPTGRLSQADFLAIIETVHEHGTPIEEWDAETIAEWFAMDAVLRGAFQHAADFLEERAAEPKPRRPIQQARREMYREWRQLERHRGSSPKRR